MLGGAGSIAGAVLGGVVVTVAQQLLASPTDSAYLFYGILVVALRRALRPWRYLAAVLAAIVGFGFAAHAIVGAISHRAVAGTPGSAGWFARALRHYVIVPRGSPLTYGNILYVAVDRAAHRARPAEGHPAPDRRRADGLRRDLLLGGAARRSSRRSPR